jgi:CubicO group peptidase (beta-lactamase class C family)
MALVHDGEGLERVPRAQAAIEEGIARALHLGAQLYVSVDRRPIVDAALGHSRPGVPLRRDDLMLWLSTTKPLTAVAVAQLWEQGMLDLDDPVVRQLPEFGAHGKDRITWRHLLTHTGGIRLLDVGWPDRPWHEIVARVMAMRPEPRWVPGRKAGYHTASSWFILGELVARQTGRPFAEAIRDRLLLPLGMNDCWIGMPPERFAAYRAAGRLAPLWKTEPGDSGEEGGGEAWATGTHPGGNGRGPLRELGRFYEMLLAGGEGPSGAPLLRSPTAAAITARHRTGMFDHTFHHVLDWGLGFILNSNQYGADTVPYGYGHRASPRTFGHSGSRSSTAFADPESGLVVALAFNGAPAAAQHESRLRAVLDGLYDDLGLAWEGSGPAA